MVHSTLGVCGSQYTGCMWFTVHWVYVVHCTLGEMWFTVHRVYVVHSTQGVCGSQYSGFKVPVIMYADRAIFIKFSKFSFNVM